MTRPRPEDYLLRARVNLDALLHLLQRFGCRILGSTAHGSHRQSNCRYKGTKREVLSFDGTAKDCAARVLKWFKAFVVYAPNASVASRINTPGRMMHKMMHNTELLVLGSIGQIMNVLRHNGGVSGG